MKTHLVAGGGISGLLAALLLAESRRGERIVLVEREADVGGLLRAFDYGEFGKFDYGMHNMYETGIGKLDDLLFGLLPAGEWQLLEGAKRDLSGLFFNGRLQSHSLYPDVRTLPEDLLRRCVADFFLNLNSLRPEDRSSAAAYMVGRFGAAIAESVAGVALRKLFKKDPDRLDVMAPQLTSFTRVVLFEEAPFLDLMRAELLRDRIAFPQQRNLPSEYASGKRGYYPVKYGMYRLVDAIRQRLLRAGVEIRTATDISAIAVNGGEVRGVRLSAGAASTEISGPLTLYWTAGVPVLARLLGVQAAPPPDRPLKTIVINLLLDRRLDVGDLYYFYCYDEGFNTFRVTNYPGYCDGAGRAGGQPICVEFLVDPAAVPSTEQLAAMAWQELERFGVLATGTKLLFSRAEPLASGFPMPTLANTRALDRMREAVTAMDLRNVVTLGILAEPGLFFQRDVLAHTYRRLQEGVS